MEKTSLNKFFLNELPASERYQVIEWMLNPVNDFKLKTWMNEHWDLLSAFDTGNEPDIDKIWLNVQEAIKKEFKPQQDLAVKLPSSIPIFSNKLKQLSAAAAILIVVVSAYFLLSKPSTPDPLASYGRKITIENNTTSTAKTIKLEDGTKVTLSAHAVLEYPTHFNSNLREVSLRGNGFFDVAKDASRPFMVYANSIVTRVLGTSFAVNTNAENGNVEVKVRTGRVQVFENEKLVKKQGSKAVILTPNQKVTYKAESRFFETGLLEDPKPIVENIGSPKKYPGINGNVNEQKLQTLFKELQNSYGIEIVVENTDTYNCFFTGDLSGDDLYKKLEIICITTNSSYEVNGTKILIKGKGCK